MSQEGWHLASPLYETDPIGCATDSPKFLNAVLEIEFEGAPKTLLKKIQAYETARGRDRSTGRNAPRTIDIDILYFGEKEVLELPHVTTGLTLEIIHPVSSKTFVDAP